MSLYDNESKSGGEDPALHCGKVFRGSEVQK